MRTRGNVKLAGLIAVVMALALVMPTGLSGTVSASIPPSCRFWGEVTLCGQSVPPGTVITVRVLDPDTGPSWTTTAFMDSGKSIYIIDIPPYDPPDDGGVQGEAVYFSVTCQGSVMAAPGSVWQYVGQKHHPLRLCAYMGDANLDGVIDGGDITKVQRIIWGLDSPTPTADANNDGVIDAGDITMIRLIIWGLVDPISCCSVS